MKTLWNNKKQIKLCITFETNSVNHGSIWKSSIYVPPHDFAKFYQIYTLPAPINKRTIRWNVSCFSSFINWLYSAHYIRIADWSMLYIFYIFFCKLRRREGVSLKFKSNCLLYLKIEIHRAIFLNYYWFLNIFIFIHLYE